MDKEVKKAKFFYYKTPLFNNVFTVCTFFGNDNEILSRGISICSLLDSFEKKEGRRRSYSRAMKALYSEENNFPINGDPLYNGTVTRQYKTKNKDDVIHFEEVLFPSYQQHIDSYKHIINDLGKVRKIIYKIDKNYPIIETSKFFNYKSEYKPTETLFMHKGE